MKNITRRNFVANSASLLAFGAVASAFNFTKNKPLLSFSTLGCPDWSFDKIVSFAAANGYDGIEFRGINRELDLTKSPAFNSAANITASVKLIKNNGLKIVNLGASANMHISDAAERKKNMDEAKRFIDLAEQIGCPHIRVFPNNLPADKDKTATLDLIARGLLELGDYAKNTNVTVLMETHGDLVKSDDIVQVMQAAKHAHVGLVWDIVNMWVITKEAPGQVYPKLKNYIHHVHVKDMVFNGDKIQYQLLGEGDSPIFTGIDALQKDGYKGYYSFEWEKLWHPEIAEPEVALADYPAKMRAHFKNG